MSTTAEQRVKPVLVADEDAQSLPAWLYYDEDFFALEREKVFMPAWHLVGHENDLTETGDYVTFKMYNEIAFVVRGKDGVVRGFHNVCRHRAARMVDGDHGNCGRSLTCPYHAWTYQLDGTLSGVPYLEQYENFDKADHGLTPVETDSFAGFVFIRFQPGGPSLKEYMAPVAEELAIYKTAEMKPLRHVGTRIREVNWKNATDNYVDALHIRVAHDGLHGLLGDSYRLDIDRGVHKIYSELKTGKMASLSNNLYCKYLPHVDHLPPERQRMWTYYKMWPGLMFDIYADQIDFMQFIPLTPTTCVLRESAYALDDDRREMKAARYLNCRINRNVNREDKGLIERVQAGMSSQSFVQGPLGKSEICLRHFAKQMRESIPLARSREKPSREKFSEAFNN
ncbi:aromatic ring-hydroxylating oxygenase subunit alpha [Hyphococcus sp.]|uniref:aromatic ring-hydroxylating oxygenase subunit alpha n=1 Tax=Hyphococcus sp. TaxID=2038636 RepID=UPI0020846563|nr:MAG: (2Fe-2S) ferredoxin [Marinicaulis sp.]